MRAHHLLLATSLALGIAAAARGCDDTAARAGDPLGAAYVTGNGSELTIWNPGEPPVATTYRVGYADPRVGTGPHPLDAALPPFGPPMLFRTGPQPDVDAEDLVCVGGARWDESQGAFVTAGPPGTLTFWWWKGGEVVAARRHRCVLLPAFVDQRAFETADGVREEVILGVPARNLRSAEDFAPAPAGRIPGPEPDR